IKKEKIFNHWKSILNTDNEKLVKFLIEFITYEDLGIDEDHEMIQLCITIQTLLDQSNDPKNPFKVYRDLKNKRQEEVDFSNLISFQFFTDDKSKDAINYKIALNPDFFKKLSEIEVDFDSVPHVDPIILDLALNVIETRIFNNEILLHEVYSIIEPSLLNEEQPSLDRMKSSFNGMKLKLLNGDRYLFSLLNAHREHKVAAQFKCLMKYIISLDATDGSDKELSTQEQALLKTLSSITNCSTGQAGGVVEAYAYLPYEAKLKTKSGHQLEVATIGQDQLPSFVASEFLYDTFQDIIETMFSGTNDLMIDICGEVKIEEPVHQGLYLRNLIGDLVGARHGLKFDRHAQLYYTNLLALTRQQAIEVFYKYANRDLKGLISFTRAKINDVVNADRSILNGLVELLKGQNDENTWLSDEADKLSITDEGVVKLLIRIDALKQDTKLF
ncbi:MAG: hypothetical protein Q8K37_03570, partial [Alphaproteobacteria bacterium]|nr:hypothetical protein [Alphaproteobacteria bacterium]